MSSVRIYLEDAFAATGVQLFGKDSSKWMFKCARCEAVLTAGEKRISAACSSCDQCGLTLPSRIEKDSPCTLPHTARVLFRVKGRDNDKPIFDFYRPAETSERTRATGKTG
jgi:hypothetical protein